MHATYYSPGSSKGKLKSSHIVSSTQSSAQLLEAIGAISKGDAWKASSQSGNYQDSTTAPLSRTHDDEAAGQDDVDQLEDLTLTPDSDASVNILPAVNKVSRQHRVYTLDTRQCVHMNKLNAFFSYARLSGPSDPAHNANKLGLISLRHHCMVRMVLITNGP